MAVVLKEIIERCSELKVCEKRQISDAYSELVFYSKDLEQWNEVFAGIFGPAAKPAGVKPAKVDARLTEAYGGIFANQTLFKKEEDAVVAIAMLWPWQDGAHVTLKMALVQKG